MPSFAPRFASCVLGLAALVSIAAAGACSSEDPTIEDDSDSGRPGRSSSGGSSGGGSSSSSGGDPGSSSSSGGAPSSSSSSSSGSTSSSGGNCNDPQDVGDMTSPKQLPEISDGVDAVGKIQGIISTDDVDAYQYKIIDNASTMEPSASTTSPNIKLCMFLACDDGDDIDIQSCGGAASEEDYTGKIRGCCGNVIDIDFECPGLNGDDTVQAYISVESTAPQCEPYTISTKQ